MPMIALHNVSKAFGDNRVLDGVSLNVEESESRVILGGSGTGKTVLLKVVLGLLRPDNGSIFVDGAEVDLDEPLALFEIRKKIGMCFQMAALFDSMTVTENISFGLSRHTPYSPSQIQSRVDECLSLVGLRGTGDLYPSELSGGMKRRVGFARAIALKPKILLFDEPTTGLDPVMTDVISKVITDLRSELRATTITITHDLKVAFMIGQNISLLHRGSIAASGNPLEFAAIQDPLVQQFIKGTSEGPFLVDSPPKRQRTLL